MEVIGGWSWDMPVEGPGHDRDAGRFPFVVRLCGSDRPVSSTFPPVNEGWERGYKRRREEVSWPAKCVRTSCWLKQLSSMTGRNGTVPQDQRVVKSHVLKMQDPIPQSGCMGSVCRPVSTRGGRSWSASPSSGDWEHHLLA